jgi:hypothetical protein
MVNACWSKTFVGDWKTFINQELKVGVAAITSKNDFSAKSTARLASWSTRRSEYDSCCYMCFPLFVLIS